MKYEIPHMLRQGAGIIINTASVSAEVGFATIAPYNAFASGAVDTPMLQRAAQAFGLTYEQLAEMFPIKRIVQPEEMARIVMWLASDDATAVVGTNIDATGGYLTA